MKIKFKVGRGKAVFEYSGDGKTLEEAMALLCDPEVISITVTKMTPTQYLKKAGAVND